jgi:hypothetical protein
MKLNVDDMNIEELKQVTKKLIENMCFTHDLILALQDRVLKLEMKDV